MARFGLFGGKKKAVDNAAELLAQCLASGRFETQLGMFSEKDGAEIYDITTIDSLEEYLESIKTVERGAPATVADVLLRITAIIRTPDFEDQPFSAMLQSLNALDKQETFQTALQHQAAQAVITMILFMEAKFAYGNKDDGEAKRNMEIACLLLTETVKAMDAKRKGTMSVCGEAIVMQELLGPFWNPSAENNPLNALRGMPSQQLQTAFYSFIIACFQEINTYKSLFGKSALLRELVNRYKDVLFDIQKPELVFPPFTVKKPHPILNIPFMSGAFSAVCAALFSPIIFAASGALVLVAFISFAFKKKKYQAALDARHAECDEIQRKYDEERQKIQGFYQDLITYFT